MNHYSGCCNQHQLEWIDDMMILIDQTCEAFRDACNSSASIPGISDMAGFLMGPLKVVGFKKRLVSGDSMYI